MEELVYVSSPIFTMHCIFSFMSSKPFLITHFFLYLNGQLGKRPGRIASEAIKSPQRKAFLSLLFPRQSQHLSPKSKDFFLQLQGNDYSDSRFERTCQLVCWQNGGQIAFDSPFPFDSAFFYWTRQGSLISRMSPSLWPIIYWSIQLSLPYFPIGVI